MKELPKPITIALLIIGFLLITGVVIELYMMTNDRPTVDQRLDELDIKTKNPQPAGINTAQ